MRRADERDDGAVSMVTTAPQTATARRLERIRELGRACLRSARDWLRAPEHAGLALVGLIALVYLVIWCLYLFQRHDIFRTGAEDMGIMDQVLWATGHGQFMRETVCNPISDVNCLGGTMRFAIHFEPILLPISLLYLVLPTPKLLLFLQTAAIASAVFPTYLLALRRLRHPAWGVAFASLFLLCPAVQTAVVDDFHPEVLAAPLLLWALYWIETRRDRGVLVACAVALLCKETLALVVICLGVYVIFGRGRRRFGSLLMGMGAGTLALALIIMHQASPIGRSPVTTRFDALLHDPIHVLSLIIADPARIAYVAGLFAQMGFLALLSPWMLVITLPSMAVNILSADSNMFSGIAQYNVHLAPFLIAGAIDGVAWLTVKLPRLARWAATHVRWRPPRAMDRMLAYSTLTGVALIGLCGFGFQQSITNDYTQYAHNGGWPIQTAHVRLGEHLVASIPPAVSVSASSRLVAHLSQRMDIYQYPSHVDTAEYILLDVTTGSFYPFLKTDQYIAALKQLLASQKYQMLAARDGYLLLRRLPATPGTAPGQPLTLPAAFFTFTKTAPLNPDLASLVRSLRGTQTSSGGSSSGAASWPPSLALP